MTDISLSLKKIEYLEDAIAQMQQRLFNIDIQYGERDLIVIITDLITTMDHAKNDLKWVRKEIVEQTFNTGDLSHDNRLGLYT